MTNRAAMLHRGLTLLAAVLALGFMLFSAGPASALTPATAETRVGASASRTQAAVGLPDGVAAGQSRCQPAPSPETAVATGVAANSGSALVRASEAAFKAADDPASIFVKNKHLASATGNGAKFASDDIGQVQGWISRGLKSDAAQFLSNGLDDTFRVIVSGGGVIGTKGQEFIRVIVTGDGRVINAFPVNVR